MEKLAEMIQMIHRQQFLVERQIAKNKIQDELDALEQLKFIVSLGKP